MIFFSKKVENNGQDAKKITKGSSNISKSRRIQDIHNNLTNK